MTDPPPSGGSAWELTVLVRHEVYRSRRTQASIAVQLGISQKHLSGVLSGKSGASLTLIDRILTLCGRRLILGTAPYIGPPPDET